MYGLPASGFFGASEDVLSILFGSAGSNEGVAALKDAASQRGPIDVITFSGGAQTFLNSLSGDPGLTSQIGSANYYSPGTRTPNLFDAGFGRSQRVFGTGFGDNMATLASDWSLIPKSQTDCGHNFPCEAAAVPPLLKGDRCSQTKVFTAGGGGGGGGGAVGGGGGGGDSGSFGLWWVQWMLLQLNPIEMVTHTIKYPVK